MPELPEVETTAALVRPHLEGRVITGARASWLRSLGGPAVAEFEASVVGSRIAEVTRRAKWVVLHLERAGRPAGSILCHLRMTGRLVVDAQPGHADREGAFERVSLGLRGPAGGTATLRFLDVRKFGRFRFVEDHLEALADLGPEPLGEEFTEEWLIRALKARKRVLKPLLLDQTFLAGLGNIYVDESLFQAGLHPERSAHQVPKDRARALHGAIQSTLRQAIEREGSSFDAFYRTPEGQPGSYQHLFRVYGREGKPCPTCGRPIKRLVVAQRGTHICTRCQPAPRAPGKRR
ncbi:Formamidopyrimidine-DNA glycosylase [Planctomycetes bacterium Poly30]|uniref:Formamidopyrimidine-DNA glycosylase n=1 Tax=Saltatorellus ferox TaxID=2528018 RepID=A0A518ENQ1_9BACT|nr:Formamidopyrimidine-DNA glycosylase [Planctomycetes bacterium Poly30]